MGFPHKFLHENEQIVLERNPFPGILVAPAAAVLAALIAAGVVMLLMEGSASTWIALVLLVVAVAAAAVLGVRWMKWRTTQMVLTTERLIFRSGVVSKVGKEIPLDRMNDISFSQSVWQRMLGFGDVMIESGGEQGQQIFKAIRHPEQLQHLIAEEKEHNQRRDYERMGGAGRAVASNSVADEIAKLAALRDAGNLTPAEFERRKQQLLGG